MNVTSMKTSPLRMNYTNWRGETALRSVIPITVHFGSTDWHAAPQWLLRAYDVNKDAPREFALRDADFATIPNPSVPPMNASLARLLALAGSDPQEQRMILGAMIELCGQHLARLEGVQGAVEEIHRLADKTTKLIIRP